MQVKAFPDKKQDKLLDAVDGNIEMVPRIVGGSTAELNEFPFFALFSEFNDSDYDDDDNSTYNDDNFINSDHHTCGGSLIAPDIVLTAAHCVEDGSEGLISKIDINPFELKSPHVGHLSVSAEKIVLHPNYRKEFRFRGEIEASMYYHDIAIVKLSKEVKTVPVLKIMKPNDPPLSKRNFVLSIGYGDTSNDDEYYSESYILNKIILSHVPYEQCKTSILSATTGNAGFPEDVTCAQKLGGDVCYGDSGGPLLVKRKREWIGVGAVSDGIDCDGQYPGWYVDFAANYEWIRTNTCIYADTKNGLQFECSDVNKSYTCTDKPNWADSEGDSCSWYGEDFNSNEVYDDADYAEYFKTHSRCAVHGDCCRNIFTAEEACCACGGGDVRIVPVV